MTDLEDLKRRILIKDAFKRKEVVVAGWVYNTRELGKIRFLILKDSSGIIQVTAVKGKVKDDIFDKITKIPRESVVYIAGKTKSSKQAPGGKEIIPEKFDILNSAEEIPIDVSDFSKTELPKRLDYRGIDLHRNRIRAIFKIQAVISSSSEGGTELFSVSYFEKKAFLAQSPQLYKQMMACSLVEKVFTITPVWRAEKHNTIRHLNESRQMDIEMAFAGQMEVMKELEAVVQYIVKNVLKKCGAELDLLKVKLKIPKVKYLSYDETVKILGMKYGEDLTPEDEKKLDKKFPDTLIFVYSWPASLKPFYIMPKDEEIDANLSEGFDAIYKGLEISSGGQRIHIPDLLIEKLKDKKLNPKDFKSYIDSFRFGAPPHAGWSIGLERLTQLITGQKNIRECCLFPRDRDRLTP